MYLVALETMDAPLPRNAAMGQIRHFESYTAARPQFKAVLDAAEAGLVTTVTRDDEKYLVVPARQLRDELAHLRPSRAEVLAEGGGWAVILPGLPVHGDGETFDSALDDAIVALREYAEDWNERLRSAPNHALHRPVEGDPDGSTGGDRSGVLVVRT